MSARPLAVAYWTSLLVLFGCALVYAASLFGGPEPPPAVAALAALAGIIHAGTAVAPLCRKPARSPRR